MIRFTLPRDLYHGKGCLEELKNLKTKIRRGRLGEPEEIAAAVCFLASEEAGYITAAMIDVNGGFYIGS